MKRLVFLVLLVLALGFLPGAAQATVTYYTDETAFLSALLPGYYNEDFSALSPGDLGTNTMNFSGNGFSYTLSATENLYGLSNAISTSVTDDTIQGTNFASTGNLLAAIGGQFYLTDFGGSDVPGTTVTVTVNGGATLVAYPDLGPRPFFGVIDTAGITSLIFETDGLSGNYATISDLTVGAVGAVPLPPSVLLLGSGLLGLVGLRLRFRK